MEEKIFDFDKTKDALSELSATLVKIETAIKTKADYVAKERNDANILLNEKEKKIASLSMVTKEAMDKIDNINKYIAEVL